MKRFAEAVPGRGEVNKANNPVGVVGHGADIAHMVMYFCSPAARFVSGQVIAVDGGSSVDQLKMKLDKVE